MHRIYRKPLLVGAYLLLLAARLSAQDDPGSVYVLSRDEARIVVLPAAVSMGNGASGSAVVSLELPIANPTSVFPTPGGKYVFVVDGETGEVVSIDSEDHRVHETFTIDGAVPISIDFSPQGHTALVRTTASIIAYDHASGRLTNPRQTATGYRDASSAKVAVNRRGTRIYVGLNDELGVFGTDDLSEYSRVDIGAEADVWSMAPDYRFLWGVTGNVVVVVDERRGRVAARRRGSYLSSPPVFVRTAGSAFLASAGQPELLRFDDRRHRVRERIPIPANARALSGDESRGVWILTEEGEVLRYDTVENSLTSIATLGEGFETLAYVGFKPGGGFACF